jgi:hypothetical protein
MNEYKNQVKNIDATASRKVLIFFGYLSNKDYE